MVSTAPWKAARSGFGQFRSVVATVDGKPVTIAGSIYDDEAQTLIAAAPEMLTALQLLVAGRPTQKPPREAAQAYRNWLLFEQARAAITKATGQ